MHKGSARGAFVLCAGMALQRPAAGWVPIRGHRLVGFAPEAGQGRAPRVLARTALNCLHTAFQPGR